jgi:hypothetical protein
VRHRVINGNDLMKYVLYSGFYFCIAGLSVGMLLPASKFFEMQLELSLFLECRIC